MVWDLRDDKYKVRNKLLEFVQQLEQIHVELPRELRKFGPRVPEINHVEFPEEKLKPNIDLPEEEEGNESLRSRREVVKVIQK